MNDILKQSVHEHFRFLRLRKPGSTHCDNLAAELPMSEIEVSIEMFSR